MTATIHHGNNLDVLPTFADCTFDAIITDPPYELGFMGKKWDATGIAYNVGLWRECLRVLKPGGHLLAFGGTRTYHRMACAIEDAGFEIRDSIHWLYGSGFPKSLDVSKAIDKAAGAEREVVGEHPYANANKNRSQGSTYGAPNQTTTITAPPTDAARQWDGWGTALKPAHEPIVLARKPLTGTVAGNVLEWGTGALNINASRIGNESRWPANVIVDDTITDNWARYFYCAKPSRAERNAGLDELPERTAGALNMRTDEHSRRTGNTTAPRQNHHPTVKPLTLIRYLCRLITPPNGHILDPFAGSGTTLAAALLEHFHATGIELTDDYLPIIQARIKWAEQQANQPNQTELPL